LVLRDVQDLVFEKKISLIVTEDNNKKKFLLENTNKRDQSALKLTCKNIKIYEKKLNKF